MSDTEAYAEAIADELDYDELNYDQPVRIERSVAVSIFTMLIPVVLNWCMGGEQATAAEMHAHVVDDYNRNRDRQRRRVARKIRKQNGDVSREQSYMMADAMIKKAIATPSDEAAMYAASFE